MGHDPKPLTYKEFWKKHEYQELKKFGMRGFVKGDRKSVLWFDLKLAKIFQNWKGKLIIGWPAPAITYARFASKGDFPIGAILEESLFQGAMPDWRECVWTWAELHKLPGKWRDALRHWRGIYYISDASDGKGYVGSAYGKENLLTRWEGYRKTGHGGNVHLRKRKPENLTFSILERVSPDMPMEELIGHERSWKRRLHTFWPNGLNAN